MKKSRILWAVMPMLWPVWVQADTRAETSRVDQVLVYPGGATVERVVAVKAGQKELHLNCLSQYFDPDSLQIQPAPGLRLGAISIRTVDRVSMPECANTPLDKRITELQDQLDRVGAEIGARELGMGYLKNYPQTTTPSSVATLTATMEALRKSAIDSVPPYLALTKRQSELKAQLVPLEAERNKLHKTNPKLRSLTVLMAATRDAEVRLSYRTSHANWVPVYRAYLETTSGQLRLERHAQLSQASGEDWTDVRLRLSTTRPSDALRMTPPRPWNVDLLTPPSHRDEDAYHPLATGAMAPPTSMKLSSPNVMGDAPSLDDEGVASVQMIEGEFTAEFDVPGRPSVAADGQQIVLKLGEVMLSSKVMARTQPSVEDKAYLVAESARPDGIWPPGPVQLFRDGAFAGQNDLRIADQEQLDLFFGHDELVRVSVEPEQRHAGAAGFIGTRTERKIGRVYRIENLHQRRFAVQVLEAAPVSRHEDIKVQAQLQPKPALESWRKQPGVMAWELTMEPKAVQRFSADYVLSYPKEATILGLPGQ
ncbi:MAG: DUF4139 domain-containing protein [Leptothrix ochracea]|uniref:DUF4139 domain-containing protein n=1 Tax=Leptothrix ochracea TaxID=735331 RepID=UPI0034E1A8D7